MWASALNLRNTGFDKIYTIGYTVYNMKRYQVYLNPQSVEIIDNFASEVDLGRAKIIRDAIDRLAANLSKVLVKEKVALDGPLDELVGIIKLKGNKKTRMAENIDEIYLKD